MIADLNHFKKPHASKFLQKNTLPGCPSIRVFRFSRNSNRVTSLQSPETPKHYHADPEKEKEKKPQKSPPQSHQENTPQKRLFSKDTHKLNTTRRKAIADQKLTCKCRTPAILFSLQSGFTPRDAETES
jgi:hypothetical protein